MPRQLQDKVHTTVPRKGPWNAGPGAARRYSHTEILSRPIILFRWGYIGLHAISRPPYPFVRSPEYTVGVTVVLVKPEGGSLGRYQGL